MKNIVVIGGGFTGAVVSKKLEKNFRVTLIDTKDYFEFTPSILKSITKGIRPSKIQVKHKNYLKNSNVIIDSVIKIEKEKVITKRSSFRYDYLIISSGSRYSLPIKEKNVLQTQRLNNIIDNQERIEAAKSVTVVGAGLVGVELAAELKTRYPKKSIFLLTKGKTLLKRHNEKTRKKVENYLEKIGVKTVFGTKFQSLNKKIDSDLFFICTGIIPNTKFIPKKYLDKSNFLKANSFLQVERNIFAGGDVTNISEEKLAQNAKRHGDLIATNIKRLEKNKPLKRYKKKRNPIVISLGKNKGVFETKFFSFEGKLAIILKNLIEKSFMFQLRN